MLYNFGMNESEKLRSARDVLLGLHKTLVDRERSKYEAANGPVTSGEFLNLLIDDRAFQWLRKFSTLIVDIDEMFAQRDGFSTDEVNSHLTKLRGLLEMDDHDEDFVNKYQSAIQDDLTIAAKHGETKQILRD